MMKIYLLLLSCIISSGLQAQAACKCNCNPEDFSMCASSYDQDHPCPVVCPAAAPGASPMATACPLVTVVNKYTGVKSSVSMCRE